MRVVAVVAGEPERDLVLAAFAELGLPRLARLVPYAATRVSDCGAGTLVVVPAGGADVAAAACAAGVAVNRTSPDLVLAIDLADSLELALTGPQGEPLDEWFLTQARQRLPAAGLDGAALRPVAVGAFAAAAVHGRRFLALAAPAAELTAAVAALLATDLNA